MKTSALLVLSIVAATAALAAVDPAPAPPPKPLREFLQQALFEEEANRDPEKAAAAYAELIAAYDQQRAFAATALFRLAEIRAKEGKKEEAIALHQRLLAEFPDQEDLAKLSREKLAALGDETPPAPVPAPKPSAEEQELKRITELLAKSPDLIDPAGKDSPLANAAEKGFLKVAAFLLDHGAKVDGSQGTTPPLVKAAGAGNKEMVSLLLEHGANVNAASANNATALYAASEEPHLEIVKMLLARKADPNVVARLLQGPRPPGGREVTTPLGCAVESARLDFATLLLDHGADPNLSPASNGLSPLGVSVIRGYEQMAALLLDRGAKIDPTPGASGWTLASALDQAPGMIPFLLERGAKIDARNEQGLTLLMLTMKTSPRKVPLLLERGANPKLADDQGVTPLHIAARSSPDLVEALLKHGADANAKTSKEAGGMTPLHECIRSFFSGGNRAPDAADRARSLRPIRVIPGRGDPPAEPKTEEQARAICAALLKAGADINARDAEGPTPLHYVNSPASDDFIGWMVSQGADLAIEDDQKRLPLGELDDDRQIKIETAHLYPKLAREKAVTLRNMMDYIGWPAELSKEDMPHVEALSAITSSSASGAPPTVADALRKAFPVEESDFSFQGEFDVLVFRPDAGTGKMEERAKLRIDLNQGDVAVAPEKKLDPSASELPKLEWQDVVVLVPRNAAKNETATRRTLDRWLADRGFPDTKQDAPPAAPEPVEKP